MGKVRSSKPRPPKTKVVVCTHCHAPQSVALRAMSIFCEKCRQRLILEDFRIKTYHASRMFATCGDIVVEKGGVVSAPIRAGNLTVRGRVQGDIDAKGVVQIAKTGHIRGDIRANRLVVVSGAKLDGFCRIVPETDQAAV